MRGCLPEIFPVQITKLSKRPFLDLKMKGYFVNIPFLMANNQNFLDCPMENNSDSSSLSQSQDPKIPPHILSLLIVMIS